MRIKITSFSLMLFCLLIFIISFLFRSYVITQLDYGLEQDEIEWGSIYALQRYGFDPIELGVWSRQVSSAEMYPASQNVINLFQIVLGENIYSARLALAFTLSISATVFFILIYQFANLKTSILITILFTFSSYRLSLGLVAEQPGFIELPLLLTLLFLVLTIKYTRTKFRLAGLFIFLASCFAIMTMITYNQSYYLPIFQLGVGLFTLILNKIQIKKSVLFVLVALLPYIFFGNTLWQNFQHESQAGSYALGNSAVLLTNTPTIDLELLKSNLSTFFSMLLNGLEYSTSDMIISHTQPIVPYIVSTLAIIGLLISFISFKKYFLFIGLSIILITIHGVFGLNLARMWVGSIVTIFIFAAIGVSTISRLLVRIMNKHSSLYKSLWIYLASLISASIVLLIVISEVHVVVTESIHNRAYSIKIEKTYQQMRKNLLSSQFLIYQTTESDFDDLTTLLSLALIERGIQFNNQDINKYLLTAENPTE